MSHTKNTSANDTANAASGAPAIDVNTVKTRVTTTLNTLFDVGADWAGLGIGYVRIAVENGARALDRTAKHLETFQERFNKKTEVKPAA